MNLMWPGSVHSDDNNNDNNDLPLPPGSFGCPFSGGFSSTEMREGTLEFGPGAFFKQQAEQLNYPSTAFKTYVNGTPYAVLVGTQATQQVLKMELSEKLASNVVPFTAKIIGKESLRFCQTKLEHAKLRQLVGAGATPQAVEQAIPQFQRLVHQQLATKQPSPQQQQDSSTCTTIIMSDFCREYTLNVAWKFIIGLDLSPQDIPEFQTAVVNWMDGLFQPEPNVQARNYLVSIIDKRIHELEHVIGHSDGSSLGRMVFAELDSSDNGNDNNSSNIHQRRLTREQIIDNTLLLILAGTDTSSGTLSAAMALLGLHPEAWSKLVQEQTELLKKHPSNELLGQQQLAECPYLEAVILETLRLAPAVSGSARATRQSITVSNQYRIPSNWAVLYDRWLTHRNDPVTLGGGGKDNNNNNAHMNWKTGFHPERWLDPKTRPTEFIPFGAGPRYCLGSNLALMEMKIFLATLARTIESFELTAEWGSAAKNVPVQFKTKTLIPFPSDGVEIRVKSWSCPAKK